MTSWDRFRVTEVSGQVPDIFEYFRFSLDFVFTGKYHFVNSVISQNGLHSCVCFSKTFKNDYSFSSFGDRMIYHVFTEVRDVKL